MLANFYEKNIIDIPVKYGGKYGPDINFVADYCKISRKKLIDLHTGVDYRVYMIANGGIDPRKNSADENITVSSNDLSETEKNDNKKEEIEIVEEKQTPSMEENLVTSAN